MYNIYHNETPLVPSIQVSLRFTFASFPPARLVIIVTTVTWNVKIYRLLKLTAEADDPIAQIFYSTPRLCPPLIVLASSLNQQAPIPSSALSGFSFLFKLYIRYSSRLKFQRYLVGDSLGIKPCLTALWGSTMM